MAEVRDASLGLGGEEDRLLYLECHELVFLARKVACPTAVQNNLFFRILPASMLCMRRLELRFSDEVASAAVLDHVAKSVACIGIGVMAGCPKGALSQVQRSR